VSAFCRALLKELNGGTKERRFVKMLGKNYLDAGKDIPLLNQLLAELDPKYASCGRRNCVMMVPAGCFASFTTLSRRCFCLVY